MTTHFGIMVKTDRQGPVWFTNERGLPYLWTAGYLLQAKMLLHNGQVHVALEPRDWQWIMLTEVGDNGEPCGEPILRWDRPIEPGEPDEQKEE